LDRPLNSEINEVISGDPKNSLTIWALSDIQPKNDKQKRELEDAIKDINNNVPDIDFAVVAGDIINESEEKDFDWYLSTKPSSYIKKWYEIAGNHDLKLDSGEGYKRKISGDFHYSVVTGNILFIFMSNEARGKPTYISDETFNWWLDLVLTNQDKIIVVVTHAPLEGSGIPFSSLHDKQVLDSERFTDVLKNYRVDMWISGHLHLPHSFTNNIVVKKKYNGTIFMNISSIRTELLGIKDSESKIITFACGSDKVFIRSRNHTKKKYEESLDAVFKISREYKCNN
jgi:predicted phosphodiesterase